MTWKIIADSGCDYRQLVTPAIDTYKGCVNSWCWQLTIITTRVSNNLPSHRNSPSLSVIH